MTLLLVTALLTATASIYVIDVLDLVTRYFLDKDILTKTLTLPLAALGCFIMGISLRESFLLVPSTTALSLIISKWTNKPIVLSRETQKNRIDQRFM